MENGSIWKFKRKQDAGAIRNGTEPVTSGHWPGKKMVLTAGLFYLGLILFGMYAQITRMGLIVSGDPAGTVEKIIASNGMLQVAFVSDVLGYVCFLFLGLSCYIIFRKISNKIAVVMLLFVMVSGSYALANMLHILDAIQLVGGAVPLTGAEKDLVMSHLNNYDDGSSLAQVIGWGPWLIPLGYLVYRSGFAPKTLGIILMVGGIGLTIQGFQYFLLPGMGDLFMPGVIVSTIGEFSICGWFLYRGIKGFAETAKKEELIERNESDAPL
jgi:hypothetical protein